MSKTVCSPLVGLVGEKLDNFFQGKNCFIEVNPGHVIMPKKFTEISDEIINCDVRHDDVWMISYPRTGITITSNIISDPYIITHLCRSRKLQTIIKKFP